MPGASESEEHSFDELRTSDQKSDLRPNSHASGVTQKRAGEAGPFLVLWRPAPGAW
jgi:hypothetical protein